MDIVGVSKTFLHLFNTYEIAGISFILYILSKEERIFKPLIALLFLTMLYNSVLKEIFKFPLPETCDANCYSFPSGHMNFCSIFYIWLILVTRSTAIRVILIALWSISGTAMVLAGYHYIRDIVITPIFSATFVWIYKRLESKLLDKDLDFSVISSAFFLVIANYFMAGNLQYHVSLAFQVILGIYAPIFLYQRIGFSTYFLSFLMFLATREGNLFIELKFFFIALIIALMRFTADRIRASKG